MRLRWGKGLQNSFMALKLSPCCAPAAKELSLKFSIPTAQLFLHRYYAVKCMQRNDRFIVACACLFLAAKVEDEPRALEDVAKCCYKLRWGSALLLPLAQRMPPEHTHHLRAAFEVYVVVMVRL